MIRYKLWAENNELEGLTILLKSKLKLKENRIKA
jgi:hypothetical protein